VQHCLVGSEMCIRDRPNTLGKNRNDASLDLENLGLRVKIKGSGKVNNISPAIGTKVKQGAIITLTLR
jgi:beta-lactam-binding protein with PASTA domain